MEEPEQLFAADLDGSALVSQALMNLGLDETAERVLPGLSERSGLIQGPGTWAFMHKTIGELLVPELICEGTTQLPDGLIAGSFGHTDMKTRGL